MNDIGEAMILAHQGQAQFAKMVRTGIARLWTRVLGRVARPADRTGGHRPYTG